MPARKTHLLKEIGKENVKNYRGVKPIVPQRLLEQLPPELASNFASDEGLQHQAWLAEITENVNRRLGSR
jgi:hypothetical protein